MNKKYPLVSAASTIFSFLGMAIFIVGNWIAITKAEIRITMPVVNMLIADSYTIPIPAAIRWAFAGVNTFTAFVFVTIGEWIKLHLDTATETERLSTWVRSEYVKRRPDSSRVWRDD